MELPLAWNGESCRFLRVLIQLHLPEAWGQVQCGKNGGVRSPDIADAFCDLLHGVFVNVGILVQFPEILHDAKPLSLFLWNTENG